MEYATDIKDSVNRSRIVGYLIIIVKIPDLLASLYPLPAAIKKLVGGSIIELSILTSVVVVSLMVNWVIY